MQNGSITGSVIGSGSSYGFDLAAGGGKIRVSDASDKNFVFSGKAPCSRMQMPPTS